MADTVLIDVEIATNRHCRSDVLEVVVAFELVLDAVRGCKSEVLHGHIRTLGSHCRQHLVISRNKCTSACRIEIVEQFALAATNTLDATESLQMRTTYVGQNAIVRFRNRGQQSDLATSACTHFNDAKFGRAIHSQKGQGHSDMVVQVATGGIDLILFGQHARHQLLGSGFAIAAGYSEDRNAQHFAVLASQILQCAECVFDQKESFSQLLGSPLNHRCIVHNGISRTLVQCIDRKAIAVETCAAQCDKKCTFADCARVGGYARRVAENII